MHGSSDCDALCRLMRRGVVWPNTDAAVYVPNRESEIPPTEAGPAALMPPF